MAIGSFIIRKFNQNEIIYQGNVNTVTVSAGRLALETTGSFDSQLPLERSKVYSININGIEGQNDLVLGAIFEDYTFVASSSDYIDINGNHHSGVVTLNSRLQFMLI